VGTVACVWDVLCYRGCSAKPTWLYSHSRFIGDIWQYETGVTRAKRALVKNYVDPSGKTRVTGDPALKKSQAYPLGFGRACASLYKDHEYELHCAGYGTQLR
jgi:hypothetical protein